MSSSTETHPQAGTKLGTFLRFLPWAGLWLVAGLCFVWGFFALFFDVDSSLLKALFLGLYLLAAAMLLIFVKKRLPKTAGFLLLFVLVLLWWLSKKPSQDRDWSPEYARTPWADITGDVVTLHEVRNNLYRSESDFTPRWETRTVHLSKLKGADLFLTFWGSPHIAHPIVSFDFGDDGHICFSVETRREKTERYSAVRGFFRQFELYYVIGDERDLIGVRAIHRKDEVVYRYPLKLSPESSRTVFLDYLRSTNQLHSKPKWYNALTTNCTTAIRAHGEAAHVAPPWDWRVLLNGHFDERLYDYHAIDTDLPFAEMKRRACINDAARRHGGVAADFSKAIRVPASR